MFSDLNFDADHLEPFAARERAATAASLGYNVIAVAHTAVESLSGKDRFLPHTSMSLMQPLMCGTCTASPYSGHA